MAELIVLYDGVCGLCTRSVRFIIRRDRAAAFRFASLQSGTGRELCRRHGLDEDALDTMVLIDSGTAYTRSDAVVRVARRLDGVWKVGALGRLVPRPIREWLYRIVARHRYRWFGQRAACWLPSADLRSRFLDLGTERSSHDGESAPGPLDG
jgi:predicted DCC family thiol-disulfide oxidoreductase YuxK